MDRFLRKIKSDGSCWNWIARKDKDGYGRFKLDGKTLQAHRVSWTLHKGPIPEGISVLHRCDNPSRVNPSHLFLGNSLDNNRDRDAKGRNGYSKRTHCPQGHAYSQENTMSWKGSRHCRACKKDYDARRAA